MREIGRLKAALTAASKALAFDRETGAVQVMPGVDNVAALAKCAADAEALAKAARNALLAAMDREHVKEMAGKAFSAKLVEYVQASIDVERLRKEAPDVAAQFKKETPVRSIRFPMASVI